MSNIKVGDMVKVKDRPDWPTPPGYKLAGSEGKVTATREEGTVTIRLVKTNSGMPKDSSLIFREENLQKI